MKKEKEKALKKEAIDKVTRWCSGRIIKRIDIEILLEVPGKTARSCFRNSSLELKMMHCKSSRNRPFSYSTKDPGSSDIFIQFLSEIRSSGVRASIAIVHIRKFYEL